MRRRNKNSKYYNTKNCDKTKKEINRTTKLTILKKTQKLKYKKTKKKLKGLKNYNCKQIIKTKKLEFGLS